MLTFGIAALASLSITLLAVFALRPIAVAVDLVDRPGGRKTHLGNIPVVGGLAMFVGLVLGTGLLAPAPTWTGLFLAACAILVTVGLIDDRFDLSPWARLPVQIAAALIVTVGWGRVVTTLGSPFGTETLVIDGWQAHVFTIACIVAAINAFNMLDGMDGLAGAMAAVAFAALTYLAWSSGLPKAAGLGLVATGAVAGFLVFSIPFHSSRALRCFMGDAGSTLLGFTVAWLCIAVSQAPKATVKVAPVTLLWIVALPLYELIWSTIRRLLQGRSPFKADTDHFHHRLLRAGFGVADAFAIFAGMAVLLAAVGLFAHSVGLPDRYSFLLLVIAGVGVVGFVYQAGTIRRLFLQSFARSATAERVVRD